MCNLPCTVRRVPHQISGTTSLRACWELQHVLDTSSRVRSSVPGRTDRWKDATCWKFRIEPSLCAAPLSKCPLTMWMSAILQEMQLKLSENITFVCQRNASPKCIRHWPMAKPHPFHLLGQTVRQLQFLETERLYSISKSPKGPQLCTGGLY